MSDLKEKAVKGVFWNLIERFGNQGIQFIIGLMLSRLLLPEDYGLVGMILIFISIAQVLLDGGFSAALIRKSDPTDNDFSTAFWFNLIIALLCYIILFFTAPLIANFFKEPRLVLLTRVVALNIIINAFGIIQKTIFTKELNFKTQALININSIVVSGIVGIYCAYNGFGYWAIVIQNLFRNILVSLSFSFVSKWRPHFFFSIKSFQELFRFGIGLTSALLLNAISENLIGIVIGKFFNARSLGYYTRAYQFQKLPVISIYGTIGAVSYPVLAELQSNNQNLKDGYKLIIRLIGFVIFPIMMILASVATPMIAIILGGKWAPVANILQLLCITGALYPLHAINIDILKVKGRTDLIFKLQIIKQVLEIIMIIICFRWGIYGLVLGEIILNLISLYINTYYSKKFLNFGLFAQLKELIIFVILSLVIGTIITFFNSLNKNLHVQFLVSPIIGLFLYIFISKLLGVKEYKILTKMMYSFYLRATNKKE